MRNKKNSLLLYIWAMSLIFSMGFSPVQASSLSTSRGGSGDDLSLSNSNAREVSFHLTVPWQEVPLESISVEGDKFSVLRIPGWDQLIKPGAPALPYKVVMIGVPFGVDLALEVKVGKLKKINLNAPIIPAESQVLAQKPIPDMESLTFPQVQTQLRMDPDIYSKDTAYPGILAEINNDGIMRGQRIAAIAVYPFQYNPTEESLVIYEELWVKIQFSSSSKNDIVMSVDNHSPFSNLLSNSLLNYETARAWQQPNAKPDFVKSGGLAWEVPAEAWKVTIKQEGFYRLDGNSLATAGFPVNTTTPENIQLFNLGQEVALDVDLTESNEVESITFFGQSVESKYTDQNVYWLTIGEQAGLRIDSRTAEPNDAELALSYKRIERFADDLKYRSLAPGPDDFDRFFMNYLLPSQELERSFYVNNPGEEVRSFRASFLGYNELGHHLVFFLNSTQIGETWFEGFTWQSVDLTFDAEILIAGENTIKVVSNPLLDDLVMVDWMEVEFTDTLVAHNEKLSFTDSNPQTWRYQVTGFVSSSGVDVYDVTDPRLPVALRDTDFSGETLTFQDEIVTPKSYFLLGTETYEVPISIVQHTPAYLKNSRLVQLIIISHPDFLIAAEDLGSYRNSQGTNTFVVDVQDVYDEFNYGIISPYAIRDFLNYTQTNWDTPAPAYVLLFGDGNYDPKNNQGFNRTSFIPPFLAMVDPWIGETASDNHYVTLDGDADLLPDMMIGRFAVNTNAEAEAMVSKVIAYEALEPDSADWQKQVLFIADRDPIFAAASEYLSEEYVSPAGYDVSKVYLGVAPYLDEASARAAVIANINDGKLFVDYNGHGGVRVWGLNNPKLLDVTAVNNLINEEKTPIVLGMTCWEGYYIFPNTLSGSESLAELFTRKETGGALASWSASGLGLATGHMSLNEGFFDAYFNNGVRTLGEATIAGKLALWGTGSALDLLNTYHLFGDPSIVFERGLTAVSDDYSLDENSVLFVSAADGVLKNDINPDNLSLEAELVSEPAQGILTLDPDGGFTYTPNLTWFGVDSFTYRAVSGDNQSNTTTVTLNVNSTNHAPVANPDSYTTLEDTPLIMTAQLGLLANDIDEDAGDQLSAYVYSVPELGSLVFHGDGSFNYYPYSNVNGTDSFTYRAYDGESFSEIATVTINITPVNDAPQAFSDNYTTVESWTLMVNSPGVLTNDIDPDGDDLIALYTDASGPLNGMLNIHLDGSFSYTPNAGFVGEDFFSYKASDGLEESLDVQVTILVIPANYLFLPLISR